MLFTECCKGHLLTVRGECGSCSDCNGKVIHHIFNHCCCRLPAEARAGYRDGKTEARNATVTLHANANVC